MCESKNCRTELSLDTEINFLKINVLSVVFLFWVARAAAQIEVLNHFDLLQQIDLCDYKQRWKPTPKPENPVLKGILETQTETDTYLAKFLKT